MRVHPSHTGEVSAALKSSHTSSQAKKSSGASFANSLLDATDKTDSSKSSAKETTKPVEGHAYADILTGPRAGMYINTSTNARKGEAFVLVNRNGREYHIYGTGKNRTVIGLKKPTETPSSGTDAAKTGPTSSTPTTPTTSTATTTGTTPATSTTAPTGPTTSD